MNWKKAPENSTYAVEVICTRCNNPYIKEIKAGETAVQRRRGPLDTTGMCKSCKNAVTLRVMAVAIPIAFVAAAIIIAIG